MDIRYLGHAAVELTEGDIRVLVDPFLTGNPKAPVTADEVQPTHIMLTHGHPDHFGDTVALAQRTGAGVYAIHEIALELQAAGVAGVHGFNLGGTVEFDGGWVRLVPAWHTSTTPGGTVNTAAGLVIGLGDRTVYHVGDTALFSDLALVGQRDHIDVALVPIGGHYTMDPRDAAIAAGLIKADVVIPIHYATMPVLVQDASGFKADVEATTASKVAVLAPGETHQVVA